ncbi:MAG: DUF418 domain-containing protein [Planctomycetota bacterium]
MSENQSPRSRAAFTFAPSCPVDELQRVHSLDTLRGFALFGVLLMNMQAFADVFATYMNPFAAGDISTLDFASWCVNHVLADTKFITIFSMLFGAGIGLMSERARLSAGRSLGVHLRRMGWLMLFGVLHAFLVWTGDILFMYGLVGLIAYGCRRWPTWLQVSIALILFLVPAMMLSQFHRIPEPDLEELRKIWNPTIEWIAAERAGILGPWPRQVISRAEQWTEMLNFLLIFGWRLLACMLFGMAMYRSGVLAARRSKRFYLLMSCAGLGAGLPLAALGIYDHAESNWEMIRSMGLGSLFNYFGSLFAAIGWIGVVMLACREGWFQRLQMRLAAVGRMALTNYLMQSLICTTIFNGHGFGLFGQVNRIAQTAITFAIFALQLWYSPRWLDRFRFGPFEWLWRSLTYWDLQPMRRLANDVVMAPRDVPRSS